ncbi:MAG: diaminohydroxyphosphoribosylaminopyrimidine deaminase [Flavobacteriales bacterium]|jgi:diaminohydroxyphosphoribosylaminopyrimidine deaminase/5-amino-6-(5-phosphoribosylamino)uracil reductase
MKSHETYMQSCMELARKGQFYAAPNPMVGSLIVHNNMVIGEGYHQRYGEAHAEVNAVASVKDKSLLKEATIYVSLEPCAHFGKTPPCSDLIIAMGIPKVVIGCVDTFSEVAGKGIAKLKAAGVEVITAVLEKECRELNKRFFTFHEKKRPYVILKWAETADGFIDVLPDIKAQTASTAISGQEAKKLVHTWRAKESAILIGKNTLLSDNPSLTVREIEGPNPVRIVLDAKASVSGDYQVFTDKQAKTIVLNTVLSETKDDIEYLNIGVMEIPNILEALYSKGYTSVFVEGGAQVLQSFIDANLWDEARIFKSITQFNKGIEAPKIDAILHEEKMIGNDVLHCYAPKS